MFMLLADPLLALNIDERLKEISFKERVYLNHFFYRYISMDQLGYVLFFNDKPTALTVIDVKRENVPYPAKLADKGWEVWKKHEHLFPHPDFIFCEEKQRNSKYFHLIVVNKKALLKALTEHEDRFTEVLDGMFQAAFKEPFSPTLFIEKLENMKRIKPLILGDQALLGILMGYGEESSLAYKYRKTESADVKKQRERIPAIPKKMLIHGKGGVTNAKLFGIQSVVWSGNPESEEIQALAATYEKQCIELRRMFRRKSCLKPVLEALCSGNQEDKLLP